MKGVIKYLLLCLTSNQFMLFIFAIRQYKPNVCVTNTAVYKLIGPISRWIHVWHNAAIGATTEQDYLPGLDS